MVPCNVSGMHVERQSLHKVVVRPNSIPECQGGSVWGV